MDWWLLQFYRKLHAINNKNISKIFIGIKYTKHNGLKMSCFLKITELFIYIQIMYCFGALQGIKVFINIILLNILMKKIRCKILLKRRTSSFKLNIGTKIMNFFFKPRFVNRTLLQQLILELKVIKVRLILNFISHQNV